MASVLQFTTLLQPLLSTLTNGSLVQTNDTCSNDTTGPLPFQMTTDLSSLGIFIYSISALQDWLKLLLFGAALEACRRVFVSSYSSCIDSFFITAEFESDNIAYSKRCVLICSVFELTYEFGSEWIMFWLASLPEWRK